MIETRLEFLQACECIDDRLHASIAIRVRVDLHSCLPPRLVALHHVAWLRHPESDATIGVTGACHLHAEGEERIVGKELHAAERHLVIAHRFERTYECNRAVANALLTLCNICGGDRHASKRRKRTVEELLREPRFCFDTSDHAKRHVARRCDPVFPTEINEVLHDPWYFGGRQHRLQRGRKHPRGCVRAEELALGFAIATKSHARNRRLRLRHAARFHRSGRCVHEVLTCVPDVDRAWSGHLVEPCRIKVLAHDRDVVAPENHRLSVVWIRCEIRRDCLSTGFEIFHAGKVCSVRIRLRKVRKTRSGERDGADERVSVAFDESWNDDVILEGCVHRHRRAVLLRGIEPRCQVLHRATDRKNAPVLHSDGRGLGPTGIHRDEFLGGENRDRRIRCRDSNRGQS